FHPPFRKRWCRLTRRASVLAPITSRQLSSLVPPLTRLRRAKTCMSKRETSDENRRGLAHHPRYAARPVVRRLDHVLEVTVRGRGAIARPAIGPGAATRFGLTGLDAGFGLGVGRRFE